jgi:hypothetical protein
MSAMDSETLIQQSIIPAITTPSFVTDLLEKNLGKTDPACRVAVLFRPALVTELICVAGNPVRVIYCSVGG